MVTLIFLGVKEGGQIISVRKMRQVLEKFFFEKNGWTGGQYSVFRVFLGLHLLFTSLIEFHSLIRWGFWFSMPLTIVGATASLFFLAGYFDRLAAVVLAAIWYFCFGALPLAPHHAEPLLIYILLAHAELPRGVFGSRGASDPDWRLPSSFHALIWFIVIVFYTFISLSLLYVDYPIVTWLLVISPLALWRRFRPFVWAVQFFTVVVLLFALGDIVMSLLLVQFYLLDPAWIPGIPAAEPERLFYDGHCGLCHRFVLFVLYEDRSAGRFVFAPLGGPVFERLLSAERRVGLPDSIVLLTQDGRVLVKSRAAIHVGRALGGLWRVGAGLARVVPRFLADAVYDLVARNRRHFFSQPAEVCPLVPSQWANRFLSE
jgi:predicted DCC family thiol-disulfide oxidoreductase YuxK